MVTKLVCETEWMPPVRPRPRTLSLLLVLLGCVLFALRGYRDQLTTLQSFDFKPVYSGARCLIDGCDPYDSPTLAREYLAHGGDPSDLRPFRPFNANYPPSALALVTPFALLPFGPAHLLWLASSAVLFSIGAFLMTDLCLVPPGSSPGLPPPTGWLVTSALLSVFVASSTMLMMLAQPAGVALGLLVIAVWCLLRGRAPVLAVVLFAMSLTLKPHLGALVWVFFLLARRPATGTAGAVCPAGLYRRRALQIAWVTVLFSLPGIIWASAHPSSAHWPAELHRNLVGIAAHGNASDSGPANNEAHDITSLQAAFSLLKDEPRFYNTASVLVCGALFLAWSVPVVRFRPSASRDLVALAAASSLTLLPLYHRQYDTRLLLLSFPAVAVLLHSRRAFGVMALAITALGTAVTSHNFPHLLQRFHPGPTGLLLTLVYFRAMPLFLLVLTSFYLVCLYRVSKPDLPECPIHAMEVVHGRFLFPRLFIHPNATRCIQPEQRKSATTNRTKQERNTHGGDQRSNL